ncbi:glycerate kinase [Shewanella maritima]|uniref:glycerate kinase n=1 Tax=Shewanella maritima TaxID=2520507 RepID=UPI003736715C
MKIVIAPDSFKESLSALEVANAIETGFKSVFPDALFCKVPVADGGEGTVQAMVDATSGRMVTVNVTGPLGEQVKACYGILGNDEVSGSTAVIEMASASGLHLVPPAKRDPLITTSFGTGELICDALERGVKRIILGLGGSATNDAGVGMLQALGAIFTDDKGEPIGYGGAQLAAIESIDLSQLHPSINQCRIDVACDVDNPLCGVTGASAIFGPQKGADAAKISQLDSALKHFATKTNEYLSDSKHAKENRLDSLAGAGAAGGMGFGVTAYLKATLMPGVKIVTDTVKLAKACEGADLVITGEGRIDGQTVFGKTPMGVLEVAQEHQVPVIGIAGCLGDNANAICLKGMSAIFPIIPALAPLNDVLDQATNNLIQTSRNIAATIAVAKKFK